MAQARKRFGQHFLHDTVVIDRILSAIDPQPGQALLEIGPGRGALTYPLLQRCKRLAAVELDRDLIPILQQQASKFGELELINADMLKFELSSLPGSERLRVVGNLPYNISTPLMFHLMDSIARIEDMHFMVQKEVALRIVAQVGDRNYGRLSVMMQYYCECLYLFDVAPESFTPPPRVDSAIIRLLPHREPIADIGDFALFYSIVQTAFGQRRKTIGNSLKAILAPQVIEASGLERRLRAENLSLQDYARLTRTQMELQPHA